MKKNGELTDQLAPGSFLTAFFSRTASNKIIQLERHFTKDISRAATFLDIQFMTFQEILKVVATGLLRVDMFQDPNHLFLCIQILIKVRKVHNLFLL